MKITFIGGGNMAVALISGLYRDLGLFGAPLLKDGLQFEAEAQDD